MYYGHSSNDVPTGAVSVVRDNNVGVSALGSCVAVIALDPATKIGGIAHIMLPGVAPPKAEQPTRYACDGIRKLLDDSRRLGGKNEALTICLVGGGNVLERDDDTTCAANIESILQLLEHEGLTAQATRLGGRVRRSCLLDAAAGRVTYTEGDSERRLLWEACSLEEAP